MIQHFLALLRRLNKRLSNFIHKIESRLKNMETEVKSDLSGLTKFATLNSLSIDEKGNYSLSVGYRYKDTAGNVLKYDDAAKNSQVIIGTAPDPTIPSDSLTNEELQAKQTSDAILAALTPVLKTLIPDVA